jgi:hypothetical protein
MNIMKPRVQKYVLRMVLGFTVFAWGLLAMTQLFARLPHGYWVILLPVPPLVYLVMAIRHFVSEGLDELQRKVVMNATAFSGVATGLTYFSYLFFRQMGAPEFRAEWAVYLMAGYYVIGGIFLWRRCK